MLPWDGEAVGEIQVRGPWITGVVLPRSRAARSSTTAGCAPATSPASPPDGYIQITDRSKDVIKSGGEWISSVELEGHLMAHPDVAEAAVIAVPDPRWDERPLACVVLQGRRRRSAPTSCASSSAASVAQWQLPERWTFIDEVPKTSVGQVRQEGAARPATPTASSTVEELRVTPTDPASTAMTTTLAASVFERLGDDLWLLVPAFVFALLAGVAHRARARRAPLVRRHRRLRDRRLGHRCGRRAAGSPTDTQPASDGFSRNLFLFTLFGAMAAAVWIEFLARPGIIVRAQTGLQSVPHPVRSLRRRGRRVQRYAEITRIAVRNGLGPSLGLGRKDECRGRRRAARRCGASGSRSRSAAGCS